MKENELLYALIRKSLKSDGDEDFSPLMNESFDWSLLWRDAQRHKVTPLVANGLMICGEALPERLLSKCRHLLAAEAYRNQYLLQQIDFIEGLLNKHHIPTISFKGPRFTEQYYGNIALRRSCDLDILIHLDHLNAAESLLLQHGFKTCKLSVMQERLKPLISTTYEKVFFREEPSLTLEIHWALGTSCYHVVSADDVWATDFTELPPRLSDEQMLLYYCGHGLGHRWDPLCHLCHIAALIKTAGDHLDWVGILHWAGQKHKQRNLLLALSLVHSLFHTQLPEFVLNELQGRRDIQRLMKRVCELLDCNPQSISDYQVLKLKFLIIETGRDRAQLLLRSLWKGLIRITSCFAKKRNLKRAD